MCVCVCVMCVCVCLFVCLCDWPDDEWDRQMKRDAATGKFAGLNEEAAQAVKSGKVKPLEEGLAGE